MGVTSDVHESIGEFISRNLTLTLRRRTTVEPLVMMHFTDKLNK